ncbi:Alpha/beta hydrolase family-domain-containing protein [Lentinula guzmanii]|uniref:Alpha/beta hydrolase family-domain-containing protein n=1 Tax=Lentinula guzmanii TaxID=2804957 RepID=A0AA38N5B9_9AGAR|nr:Alpha/beta hydrolase family-domain-containing protein [Lentinula guzmanii]
MAPELPPDILQLRPGLPSPPRTPLWHDNPDIPYTLSTHIIDASPLRTFPQIKLLDEVSLPAYARMQTSNLDTKGRQKVAQEQVGLMLNWRREQEETRRSQRTSGHERRLWLCLNRYVKKDLDKAPRKTKGLTLIFAHALGVNKETWEPLIMRLVKSRAGRDVEEIWVWESVDTGDSALLNSGKLNQLPDWYDGAKDILHFLLHYMPSRITSDRLPVHLPRVSVAEFEERERLGFSERQIIAIGHSYGGNNCGRACYSYPQCFSALVLVDPGIVKLNDPTLRPTLRYMAQGSYARRDSWKSREEALALHKKSSFFGAWHPEALRMFIECGLYSPISSDSDSTVYLKTHPVLEALAYTNGVEASEDMYAKVPSLDQKVYIKWVMPDRKKGGGLAGPESSDRLVKLRPGNTSNVNIAGASHMIPLEKPDEVAREIADTIEIVGATSAKM